MDHGECGIVNYLTLYLQRYTNPLKRDIGSDFQVYEAFARSVVDQEARRRRIKKVGLWSLQLGAQVLLMSLQGVAAAA
jgi:Yeast mitochondrial distribution and morphology (MDM) proteins